MATVKELGEAIARHPQKVTAIFVGFDLWLGVIGTGKVNLKYYKKGGVPAAEDEPDGVAKVPLQVVGRDMVLALDITLPPDGFRLAP